MTLLSIALEAAERGLVADEFTRAAIRSLCRERLRRWKSRTRERIRPNIFCNPWPRARSPLIPQRPTRALRAAAGILRFDPRPASEIQLLFLVAGRAQPRGGRGSRARHHVREGRITRRPGSARSGLRMGRASRSGWPNATPTAASRPSRIRPRKSGWSTPS